MVGGRDGRCIIILLHIMGRSEGRCMIIAYDGRKGGKIMFDDHHTFLLSLCQVSELWSDGRVAVAQNMPIFIYRKSIVLPDRNINDECENMYFK